MDKTTKGQVGDVSFINALNEITRLRWKLLGFDVNKSEVTGAGGGPVMVVECGFDPTKVTGPAPVEGA